MKLSEIDFDKMYLYESYVNRANGVVPYKFVDVLNSLHYDGASLIVETRDENGDIFSGDIFTCEAGELSIATEEAWKRAYNNDECIQWEDAQQ